MKKNNDYFIKYLSGILSENECKLFKQKLETDESFNKEYENIISHLKSFNITNSEIEEKYFINLLPIVREKISSKRNVFSKRIAFGIPTFIVTAILLFVVTFNSTNKINQEQLVDEVVNNLSDNQVSQIFYNEVGTKESEKYFDLVSSEPIQIDNLDNKTKQSIMNVFDLPFSEEYTSLNKLTEEDISLALANIETPNLH